MKLDQLDLSKKDIKALSKVIKLINRFIKKNIIYTEKRKFKRIERKFQKLWDNKNKDPQLINRLFRRILKYLKTLIDTELKSEIIYLVGGHGGVIINNIGFCEFDSPPYAIGKLLGRMELAIKNNFNYNLEISICCLDWFQENYPDRFSRFIELYKKGSFELINPTYSQPYNLIIGPESNLKQIEFGLKVLSEIGIKSQIFHSSESSLHPQIPQLLKGFNIRYGSLKTRLLGGGPTAITPKISWKGLDNTTIESVVDLSGLFDGEYWHGTFYKEIPNLLFQAAAKPFINQIVYSSIEDFIVDQPLLNEVWRISRFSDLLGKFRLFSDFLDNSQTKGEFKFTRDEFLLGDSLFIASDLFLQNIRSETSLITAEIIYSIVGMYESKDFDDILDNLWKDLLLTQSHDCFAVPFLRHGDYCQFQLPKEESNKIKLQKEKIQILDLSLQLHKDIQKKCKDLIGTGIKKIIDHLTSQNTMSSRSEKVFSVFVFNPTPYTRKDIIKVEIKQNYFNSEYNLLNNDKIVDFYIEGDLMKFIAQIPGFGYKMFQLKEKTKDLAPPLHKQFKFDVSISNDNKLIHILHNGEIIYDLSFQIEREYELQIKQKDHNNIQKRYIIVGNIDEKNLKAFKLKLIQYKEINRLEFFLESGPSEAIILNPRLKIQSSYINYPFGIEKTRRTKIQTLNFLCLKAQTKRILYIVKNSQKFMINHSNYTIKNLLNKNSYYEFAISLLDEMDDFNPLYYVNSYNFNLLGAITPSITSKSSNSFLSLETTKYLNIVNLWRRGGKNYLRIFNPTNEYRTGNFKGELVQTSLKEVDLNLNQISETVPKKLVIKPWEIKTFRF